MPDYGTYAKPRLALAQALMQYPTNGYGLIGMRALPPFMSPVKTGAYTAITRASILRARDVKRAPKSIYNRDTYEGADVSFNCAEYGQEQALDDSERALYMSDFEGELVTAAMARDILLREQEKRVAAALQNTSTFTGSALYTDNSGTPWSTAGTDIVAQVDAARDKVRANSGLEANAVVMSVGHRTNIKKNTGIKAALQYVARATEAEILGALADLFGVRYVLMGGGAKNTAAENATASISDIWSTLYVWVGVIAETQALSEPCIGRTIIFAPDSSEVSVEEYREEQTRSTIYRARHNVQELIQDAYFGHLMKVL